MKKVGINTNKVYLWAWIRRPNGSVSGGLYDVFDSVIEAYETISTFVEATNWRIIYQKETIDEYLLEA